MSRALTKRWRWAWGAVLALGLGACEVDKYETGDSRYSYLRADFAMLHTTDSATANYMLTDDGDSVAFAPPARVGWAATPDSLYRALVHYDVKTHECFAVSRIPVVRPTTTFTATTPPTDPLTIESVWVAGGFLNIGFAVKTGATDSIEARQQIGLALDSTVVAHDLHRTLYLRVTHAQNGVPEYYTVRGYMSMPLAADMRGATIEVSAQTYKGVRAFSVESPL